MAISLESLDALTAVSVAYGRTRPAWAFDVPAITRAAERLGVSAPVEVCCAEYRTARWLGMHSYEHGIHRVRVARWLDANSASAVLWHELTHAAQQDRGDDMTHALTLTRRRRLTDAEYYADAREAEAAANERLASTQPLVRA